MDFNKQFRRLRTQNLPTKRTRDCEEQVRFGLADDAYEEEGTMMDLLRPWLRRRPFPFSQHLVGLAEPKPPCPLLREFFQAAGVDVSTLEAEKPRPKESVEGQSPEAVVLDATSLDDPRFSTISRAKHESFLRLSSLTTKTKGQLREYHNLCKRVKAEQQLYSRAVRLFWEFHRERISAGFTKSRSPATAFAEFAAGSAVTKRAPEEEEGKTETNRYEAKCCQIISLPTKGGELREASRFLTGLQETLNPTVLHVETCSGRAVLDHLPENGDAVPLPKQEKASHGNLLSNDERARELAVEHGAHIICSEETLRALLQDPSCAQWTVSVEKKSLGRQSVAVLDMPVPPSFVSPRDCLTRGFREGLYQWLEGTATTERQRQNVYVLVKLPPVESSHKPCRVLVRITNRIWLDQPSLGTPPPARQKKKAPPCPLRIHTSVEYFPERGTEMATSYDNALWILDHVLQPSVRLVVGRVDPFKCRLMEWEEISLAHALTEATSKLEDPLALLWENRQSSDLSELWRTLIHLLRAVPSIGQGHHLMCFPGRSSGIGTQHASVSVHKACSDGMICLEEESELAGQVPLGAIALLRCFRPWKWDHSDRITYTFPVVTASEEDMHGSASEADL